MCAPPYIFTDGTHVHIHVYMYMRSYVDICIRCIDERDTDTSKTSGPAPTYVMSTDPWPMLRGTACAEKELLQHQLALGLLSPVCQNG